MSTKITRQQMAMVLAHQESQVAHRVAKRGAKALLNLAFQLGRRGERWRLKYLIEAAEELMQSEREKAVLKAVGVPARFLDADVKDDPDET